MAKKPAASPAPVADAPDAPLADEIQSAMVEVPQLKTKGYAQQQIDVTLTAKQAETLRDVTAALRAENAFHSSGRPVRDQEGAIKWILDQVKR